MPLPEESVGELAALAGVVLGQEQLHATLAEICRIAARAVPNAVGASLTSFSEGGPSTVASSDEWASGLDEMQYTEREGPCYDAARTGVVFRVRDTAAEPRWPSYMPRAAASGARSMVSIPTMDESKTIGALNVYAREPDAFGPEEVSTAEVIAAHATLASQVASALFRHKELAEQLQEAIESRAAIEQAKGILIAAQRCSPDEAFEMLRRASQRENRKLRDVAAEVVERAQQPR